MTIIFLLMALLTATYLLYLLHALKSIRQELKFLSETTTNKELHTFSRNPLLVQIVKLINCILVKNKTSRQQLIAENQQIDQAINNISHDLRTPLAVATGYTQYLMEEKTDPAEQTKTLESIRSNLAVVETRLEQLLDYNRLNEQRIHPQPEVFDLSELLKETILNMYDSFTSRGFEVSLDIAPNISVVQDKDQTARIIQNLLGNILIHGSRFASISLNDTSDNKKAILIMSNGLTQPIQFPERLTERFYTEDLSRQKETSGLGLYIVKRLLELQADSLKIQTSAQEFSIQIKYDLPSIK